MLETIYAGTPKTSFLKFGDWVRMEILSSTGQSIFGEINQRIESYSMESKS